jgi:uncharacterized protein (TIGR00255 family)
VNAMLKSMTGYGRVKVENAYREILVEVRSVNHRYLDLNIKVPRIYGFLEEAVKKQASEVLARGKVDLYVSVRAKEGSDLKITPNMPVIDGYMAALSAVAQRYGMEQTVTPQQLLQMPDAIAVDKEEADAEVLTAEVLDVLRQALEEHYAMREKEGKKLCEDIAYRAGLIRGYVDFVEKRSPVSVEEYRQRIAVRMEELLDGSELAQQRILNEAAIFADKVSVTEEIVRLRSHLAQLETMLQSPAAVGRKLDFLVQELNRETNTIGSKANDYEIAKIVVEMKAEIEKIREQIQNLE